MITLRNHDFSRSLHSPSTFCVRRPKPWELLIILSFIDLSVGRHTQKNLVISKNSSTEPILHMKSWITSEQSRSPFLGFSKLNGFCDLFAVAKYYLLAVEINATDILLFEGVFEF